MEWLFFVVWYASGLVGSWLVIEFALREDFDITVGVVLVGMVFAIFGPIGIVVALSFRLLRYLVALGVFSRVILHKRGLRE